MYYEMRDLNLVYTLKKLIQVNEQTALFWYNRYVGGNTKRWEDFKNWHIITHITSHSFSGVDDYVFLINSPVYTSII